ncbi:hypothetical protein [Thalassovita taeanensis]|uniref:Uncharacterized protein n=1 Tax=Thalassovita taeanensis TaxID=657014 RepID=A0A1H9CJ56_9RHOB|nr:hypothetical protein [Thalassovita taeanensis]SEQ01260.1 hypothetical protein SAMN04488092_103280 [Thalassovita taeanensis]
MKRLIFCALLLLICARGALAATAEVRSGEHVEFTRLVVDLPTPAQWTIRKDDRSLVLDVSGPKLAFDLRHAFDRIDRSRVASLKDVQGQLHIGLACDCAYESYILGSRMLVIDVSSEINPLPSHPPEHLTKANFERLGFGQYLMVEPLDLGVPVDATETPLFGPAPQTLPALRGGPPSPPKTVGAAEKRLLMQLGRAASQGLLDVKTRAPINSPKEKPLKSTQSVVDPKRSGKNINLRAQTSIDRELRPSMRLRETAPSGAECLSDDDLDIANWRHGGDFASGQAELRLHLGDEIEQIDPNVALKLARHYLHFGIGAEATQVLRFADETSETDVLFAIANIFDGEPDPQASALRYQIGCDTSAALWALLASKAPTGELTPNIDAILRAFSAFPEHLKQLTAPELSEKLLAAGEMEAAQSVLRINKRSSTIEPTANQIVSAKIDAQNGELEKASQTYENVLEDTKQLPPESLLAMVDTYLSLGQPISPAMADLISSYAYEYQKDTIGPALSRASILARADSGQFDAAYSELGHVPSPDHDPQGRPTYDGFLDILTRKAEPFEFVKYSSSLAEHAAEFDRNYSNHAARRLVKLGFPETALKFLVAGVEGPDARDRRILRALAALEMADAQQAEADVLGLNGPDVEAIRAKAKSILGQHDAAYHSFIALQDQDAAQQEAWLAGNWQGLAQAGQDEVSELAHHLLTEKQQLPTHEKTSLAHSKQLLGESVKARTLLEAVLASKDVKTAPP